ncbi:hypothetical protein [Bacillus thuringiensis]
METVRRKISDEHLKERMKGKRIGTVTTGVIFISAFRFRYGP